MKGRHTPCEVRLLLDRREGGLQFGSRLLDRVGDAQGHGGARHRDEGGGGVRGMGTGELELIAHLLDILDDRLDGILRPRDLAEAEHSEQCENGRHQDHRR